MCGEEIKYKKIGQKKGKSSTKQKGEAQRRKLRETALVGPNLFSKAYLMDGRIRPSDRGNKSGKPFFCSKVCRKSKRSTRKKINKISI